MKVGRRGGRLAGWSLLFPVGILITACRPAAPVVAAPVRPPADSARPAPDSLTAPIALPAEAAAMGWMPLASTNVPGFLALHPTYDGRGVLIAILDGGVDPVPGVDRLPDGSPKIVEVRDFSGEGRIVLTPAEVAGDFVRVQGQVLRGAGRVRTLAVGGVVYGGTLVELALGDPPAADLNGNGTVADTLVVVVLKASDGWVLLADTNGDGSLADERPVRDYLIAQDRYGWRTGAGSAPTSVAVNLADGGDGRPPVLDLVFDTIGHGTHVSGIAAGHSLYRVIGFDGVAPGAEILDLKIANDARGGISRTGSMLRALDHAIRFAAARRKPLVVNLSYGVGNEAEGAARIDALVDSVLAVHPDVVVAVSAGNEGPGLSTIGFPGSARRVISVGATYPGAFLPPRPDGRRFDDQVAFFSSRGGEVDRPDLVAPGVAYSTVPRWYVGEEIESGTSMAAPHVAGLAALLLSGLKAEGRPVDALTLRRALVGTSRWLHGLTPLDQGAGEADVLAAWNLLAKMPPTGRIEVAVSGRPELSGAWRTAPPEGLRDTLQSFHLTRTGPGTAPYSLRGDVAWVLAPPAVAVGDSATVTLRYRPDLLRAPGSYIGVVEGWGADSAAGPAFRLVSTIIVPRRLASAPDSLRLPMPAGDFRRTVFAADSGRPVRISISESRGSPMLAFLHEPGGMPWRGGQVQLVGGPDSAAVFRLDGRDVVAGTYELVTMAGPATPVDATVVIDPSPWRIDAVRNRDTVTIQLGNLTGTDVEGEVSLELIGAERGVVLSSRGSADRRVAFTLPAWASRLVIELLLDRAEWPRFTDFGLTLEDAGGRQFGHAPLNYALGLLEVAFPVGSADRIVELVLSPGFAEPDAQDLWHARLAIRLFAGQPIPVSLPAGGAARVPAGGTGGTKTLLPPLPWTLGDGFFPLARVTTRVGDHEWSRQSGLPNQLPPIMP